MYGKRKLSGHHRAQSPARASNTTITAMCIISAIIASIIIFSVVILAGEPKKAIQISPRAVTRSSSPASPLGGDDLVSGKNPREVKGMDKPTHASVTTHILHDEPLEGGGQSDSGQVSQDGSAAPQQRSIWTTNATAYVRKIIAQQEAARVRQNLVNRINAFLGNSPLRGLGECMMANADRTGVWVMLCPAQAYAESSLGAVCCYPCQPFGMYGVHPSSWEDAIARYFDNIVAHWGPVQNCHELVNPDYCEPPEPYNSNVQGLAESI